MQIVGQIWLNLVTWTCGSWSEGISQSSDFALYLRTVWCLNMILWDYESAWNGIWPQNKCMWLWPIFHGPVILSFSLKSVWYMNTILSDYETVWPDVWPQNICGTLWPIFHGPVILPYSLKTIWYMNTLLLDYESVWQVEEILFKLATNDHSDEAFLLT